MIRFYSLISFILFLNIQGFAQESKPFETDIYKNRIKLFKQNPLEDGKIVFLGNSLIQNGNWEVLFSNNDIRNRGIIGNNTEGMITILPEIIESKPEKLFFIGGINDISQDIPNNEIIKNISCIIKETKSKSPETKIFVHSVLPINNSFERYKKLIGKEKQIIDLNKSLKKLCKKEKVTFINLYPALLDPNNKKNGTLDASLTNDGLHLNQKGYEIWAKIGEKFVN